MKYTNKYGLPDAFFRAVVNDKYDRGDTYSPTMLNSAPRALVLLEQNPDVEVDVSTRVAITIGKGAHATLETAKRVGVDIVEVRYSRELVVDGVTYMISAQVDLFETDTGTLSDWKTAKAYAFHKKSGRGKKDDWKYQLNVGRWVLAADPTLPPATKIQIIGLLKDWDNKKAKNEAGYPETEIMVAEQELLSDAEIEAWIAGRIRAIVAARIELPLCSTKDNWGGRKCGQWCDANSICTQYQEMLTTGLAQRAEGE